MNTTVTVKEELRNDSLARDVRPDKIQESKTNPRSHFDEGALAERAVNIKEHGVLQPVLLRPRPNGESESYELVVGSRRYRALSQRYRTVTKTDGVENPPQETLTGLRSKRGPFSFEIFASENGSHAGYPRSTHPHATLASRATEEETI